MVEDGQVKAGRGMIATISTDHRFTDGAEAARFINPLTGILDFHLDQNAQLGLSHDGIFGDVMHFPVLTRGYASSHLLR